MKKTYQEEKSQVLVELGKQMTPSRIKSIRKLYGLTQVNFADLCGISYHTYKNWEIGHRKPCTPAVSLLTLAEQNTKIFLTNIEEFKKMYKLLSI